ncbi:MAG TPA: hypothetical protein PLF75_05230, partial [Bacteroidales bacterium]|nr:hypothetical protein [Bacteroidales bacterium]
RICAAHRTTLGFWVVLIFMAVNTAFPQANLLLISNPAAVRLNLIPSPSLFLSSPPAPLLEKERGAW